MGRVEMMFLEIAEDDSRTNRVDASVDILVGTFGAAHDNRSVRPSRRPRRAFPF
jgi:hypothetical protein